MPKGKMKSRMYGNSDIPMRTKIASPMGTGGMGMAVSKTYTNQPRTAPSHARPKNQIV